MMDDFVEFGKIARWSREVIVTEKIDGTNAQVVVCEDGVTAGSRNRYLTPENDNYGFAKWVKENEEQLRWLGPGRHFGEWWGPGIQRRYGTAEKRFSLFNVSRHESVRPPCCHVVPVLWRGNMDDMNVAEIMEDLLRNGSVASPGFMRPEGIVIYHVASRTLFKKTFEKDASGKGE